MLLFSKIVPDARERERPPNSLIYKDVMNLNTNSKRAKTERRRERDCYKDEGERQTDRSNEWSEPRQPADEERHKGDIPTS